MTKLLTIITLLFLFIFSGCSTSSTATPMQDDTHLIDSKGMTLYTFDKDTKDKSNCYNGCEVKWPVFYGEVIDLKLPKNVNKEDFGTIKRKNGTMQTTYKSQPLYYFFKDKKAGDVKGDGVKGVWHIIN